MFRKSILLLHSSQPRPSPDASFVVASESLEEKTAFALGLEKGDFTISNREDKA